MRVPSRYRAPLSSDTRKNENVPDIGSTKYADICNVRWPSDNTLDMNGSTRTCRLSDMSRSLYTFCAKSHVSCVTPRDPSQCVSSTWSVFSDGAAHAASTSGANAGSCANRHVISNCATDSTSHGMPPTDTVLASGSSALKDVPVMVNTVPPATLPTFGWTDVTAGTTVTWYGVPSASNWYVVGLLAAAPQHSHTADTLYRPTGCATDEKRPDMYQLPSGCTASLSSLISIVSREPLGPSGSCMPRTTGRQQRHRMAHHTTTRRQHAANTCKQTYVTGRFAVLQLEGKQLHFTRRRRQR